MADGLPEGLQKPRVLVQQGQAQRKGQNGLGTHLGSFGGCPRLQGTRLASIASDDLVQVVRGEGELPPSFWGPRFESGSVQAFWAWRETRGKDA